ncbi:MAG: BTAD domain-containing putative transcriptional regulator [Sphingobacteriaceae bacterium]
MQSDNRLEQLLKFLKQEPDDPFLQYALATEHLRRNKLELALFYYESLVDKHPSYLGTYYHLGKLYEQLDRQADAIKTYQTGMQLAKDTGDQHAFSELQNVYNAIIRLDYEDD